MTSRKLALFPCLAAIVLMMGAMPAARADTPPDTNSIHTVTIAQMDEADDSGDLAAVGVSPTDADYVNKKVTCKSSSSASWSGYSAGAGTWDMAIKGSCAGLKMEYIDLYQALYRDPYDPVGHTIEARHQNVQIFGTTAEFNCDPCTGTWLLTSQVQFELPVGYQWNTSKGRCVKTSARLLSCESDARGYVS